MSDFEIQKKFIEACETQISSLNTERILRKAKMNLENAVPAKIARQTKKSFLFSTRRGIAVLTASVMLIIALGAGIPLGLWFSGNLGNGNLIVENITIVNNNIIIADNTEEKIQLTVKIKHAGKAERNATRKDVTFESSNLNVATVDENGLVAIAGAGSTNIIVESINKAADGNRIRQTMDLPVISSIPTDAALNTKVTLPKALTNGTVIISVKYDGEDVNAAEVDPKTGYAIGLTSEKAEFNNDDKMSFYPTKTGVYTIEYYLVDPLSNKSSSVTFKIYCSDTIGPQLVNKDDWQIPSEWGTRVFEYDADTGSKIEVPNIIVFPYPEFIDNSGEPVTVRFTIMGRIDTGSGNTPAYLVIIQLDDIDKNENKTHSNYYGSADFTKEGLAFDITKCPPSLQSGLIKVEYFAVDKAGRATIIEYEIMFYTEYIKA